MAEFINGCACTYEDICDVFATYFVMQDNNWT